MTDLVFNLPITGIPPVVEWMNGLEWANGKGPYRLPAEVTSEGFIVLMDDDGGRRPPCVHTAGLTDYGLPELVFFGSSPEQLCHLWEALQEDLPAILRPGSRLRQGRLDGIVVPVCPAELGTLSDASSQYQRTFSAAQLYWVVGAENHSPESAELEFLARQPYLGFGTLRRLLEGG